MRPPTVGLDMSGPVPLAGARQPEPSPPADGASRARDSWSASTGAHAVEDLIARGPEDRRADGRLELVRIVELSNEPSDVELVHRSAEQRSGREGAVDGAVGDRGDDRLHEPGQIGLCERF